MGTLYERNLFGEPEGEQERHAPIPFEIALLALGYVRGLGQKGLRRLVSRYGDDLGHVFGLNRPELVNLFHANSISGAEKLATAVTQDAEGLLAHAQTERAELAARNVHVLPPSRLPGMFGMSEFAAPGWLFVEGNTAVVGEGPTVALVGTRAPSDRGLAATRIIADVLGRYPHLVVVSGLAQGIDGCAHRHTLDMGLKNLAFLGHGINLTFPQETSTVRHSIVRRGGAVVSEYMPNQSYQRRQFVERNRLQAALADLVIPVEAAAASGTAHTIRFARQYGRRLVGMVWPGANGIVDDLRANGDTLIDIFSPDGPRLLDEIIRDLFVGVHADHYPLGPLERLILRRLRSQQYTQEHLDRLLATISREGRRRDQPRTPNNGSA